MEVEQHSPVNTHETIEEVDEEQLNAVDAPSWRERVQKIAVNVSSTAVGQWAIRQADRLLWTVEKTVKWSCPEEQDPRGRPATLIRPLPWLIFLPTLIALRWARFSASIGSMLIGCGSIAPIDVVAYTQTFRRKMRTFKYQGLRNIRLQKQEAEVRALSNGGQAKENGGPIKGLLSTLARGICTGRVFDDDVIRVVVKKKKNSLEIEATKSLTSNKRNRSDDDYNSSSDELKKLMEQSFDTSDDSNDESVHFDLVDDEDTDDSERTLSSDEETEKEIVNNKKIQKPQTVDQFAHSENNEQEQQQTIENGNNQVVPTSKEVSFNESNSQFSTDSSIDPYKYQNGSVSDDNKISGNNEVHHETSTDKHEGNDIEKNANHHQQPYHKTYKSGYHSNQQHHQYRSTNQHQRKHRHNNGNGNGNNTNGNGLYNMAGPIKTVNNGNNQNHGQKAQKRQ